jgi:hypothetical protein
VKSVASICPREPDALYGASHDSRLKEIDTQKWENARHLRTGPVLGANVPAIVVAFVCVVLPPI